MKQSLEDTFSENTFISSGTAKSFYNLRILVMGGEVIALAVYRENIFPFSHEHVFRLTKLYRDDYKCNFYLQCF
jgi:hypothetical protein